MVSGRLPIITSVEEMDARIDAHLAECVAEGKPVTLTGMCIAIGFNSKDTFYRYGEKPLFSDSIKRARLYIENQYELNLHSSAPTGSIFALKNMGWKDHREKVAPVDHKPSLTDAELEAIASGSS